MYNPYPKMPKNIRQVGERDQAVRLYLEDYVNTYLKRLYPKGGQDLRVGVLLGTAEEHDGTPYLFVDGAMEMEDVAESGEKVVFTETAWKKTYQGMEQMFPKRVILGWFLCGVPGAALSPLNYWKQHGQYFAGKNQLMYLNSGLEGEEAVYITSEDGFYKLRGYSIYYERNQMMQDYMISRKDVRRVESGTGDTVIRDYRQRMEENRSQAASRRSAIRLLGSVCSALAVTVLAGGVVLFNNYEKMREMEAVLASVLPGQTEDGQEGGTDRLWVEEASGGVYPTVSKETMSDTYPDPAGEAEAVGAEPSAAETGPVQTGAEAVPGGPEPEAETAGAATETGEAESSVTEEPASAGEEAAAVSAALEQGVYRVQDGETLYGICLKLYGDGRMMDEICSLNGLEDENKIMSGQNLILP